MLDDRAKALKEIEEISRAIVAEFSNEAKRLWVRDYFGGWERIKALNLEKLREVKYKLEADAASFINLVPKCHQKGLVRDSLLKNFGRHPNKWRVDIKVPGQALVRLNPLPVSALGFSIRGGARFKHKPPPVSAGDIND